MPARTHDSVLYGRHRRHLLKVARGGLYAHLFDIQFSAQAEPTMDATVLLIFSLVYLGMILGEIPGLALDRTGVALLGAIALLATGRIAPREAWEAIDYSTIGLLFGLMVVSAQFRLGGFYSMVTRRIAAAPLSPPALLGLLIAVAGALSALLCNDIVCLAMTPVLVEGCARRRLNPVPYLLGLACASNVGSAATLIGNPQNMLIGQTLNLSFAGYLGAAAPPSVLGLAAVWAIVAWQYRRDWACVVPASPAPAPPFNSWQSAKGVAVLLALVVGLLWAPAPAEVLALSAGGLLLLSRRMASREILGLVDWHLLVLFIGLFIVNRALNDSGMAARALAAAQQAGLDFQAPVPLFGLSVVLSNVVSNVPATMLLLPAATHALAGPVLALSSTLAGNLLIVGSIANIIVIDQAGRQGVRVTWATHLRTGVPVTAATLAIAAGWLFARSL